MRGETTRFEFLVSRRATKYYCIVWKTITFRAQTKPLAMSAFASTVLEHALQIEEIRNVRTLRNFLFRFSFFSNSCSAFALCGVCLTLTTGAGRRQRAPICGAAYRRFLGRFLFFFINRGGNFSNF